MRIALVPRLELVIAPPHPASEHLLALVVQAHVTFALSSSAEPLPTEGPRRLRLLAFMDRGDVSIKLDLLVEQRPTDTSVRQLASALVLRVASVPVTHVLGHLSPHHAALFADI